jgi:hypothetical protein
MSCKFADGLFRLGRRLGALYPTLQAVCRMHQGCLALVGVLGATGTLSPLFCTSILLRRRRIQKLLRLSLKLHLDEHLHIEYEEPPPEQKDSCAKVLTLLDFHLSARFVKARQRTKGTARLGACRRLARNLHGDVSKARMSHVCRAGCHPSAQLARAEIEHDLLTLFLDHPPPVPAWNKWNKIVGPTVGRRVPGAAQPNPNCIGSSFLRLPWSSLLGRPI